MYGCSNGNASLLARAVLVFSLLTLLLPSSIESRTVGSCKKQLSKCRGKKWHHDAVCNFDKQCLVVSEREFAFKVVAKMRSLETGKEVGKKARSLWMRGSGPGLSWDKPVELRRSGSSVDSWKTDIKYRSSSDALLCTTGDNCFANQRAVEFRLYRDQMGKEDMLGPNFYVELPLSESMKGAANFLMPSVTVYPWFDGDIVVREFNIESSLHVTGQPGAFKTTLDVLYPPSFHHNIRKRYPLVIYLGYSAEAFAPLLEYAFIHEAHTREALVVGLRPLKQSPPYTRLSPYRDSHEWQCKSSPCNIQRCATCWLPRTRSACDKSEFIYQAKQCLKPERLTSYGEEVLDFIEMDIIPKLREVSQERVMVDFPRQRISIFGDFDGASLLACYAAVTRPHVYQNAACLAAPFYWPLTPSPSDPAPSPGMRDTFRRIRDQFTATPALRSAYLTQRYYIDVAFNQHALLPLLDVYEHTDDFVRQLEETLSLERGKNILYFTVPDRAIPYALQKPSVFLVYNRILPALKFFLRAEGGPSKEGARSRPVLNKMIAEQNERYGGLITPANNSVPAEQELSCDAHYTSSPAGGSRPTEVPIIFFLPVLGS